MERWTYEAPTESGWYWLKHKYDDPVSSVVRVVQRPGHEYLAIIQLEKPIGREFLPVQYMTGSLWSGSLKEPI